MANRFHLRQAAIGVAILYLVICALGAVVLCQIALHPPRRPIDDRSLKITAERQYNSVLTDATVTAPDGASLRG